MPCLLPFRLDEKRIITLSDEKYLKYRFKIQMGKNLDLNNPKTYNEKLQWLKLHDRNPEYTKMVDKYEVKKYIADTIGEEYVIPTLGIYDTFSEIEFDKLPNQFVMKSTHDSGSVVICRDKSKFDIKAAEKKLNMSLKHSYFYGGREWPYKNIKPRIIIEKYMEDKKNKELRDYKFFCFDGVPKLLFIATDRLKGETKFNYYDMNFNKLDFKQHYPNDEKNIEKPKNYNKMISLAKKLSKDIPHVRVDFYEMNDQIYFGELTFYHFSGFQCFEPEEWDYKLGELINLDKVRKNEK